MQNVFDKCAKCVNNFSQGFSQYSTASFITINVEQNFNLNQHYD